MTTEPKMPPLPECEDLWYDCQGWYSVKRMKALEKQWAERVAELERVLGVARDALGGSFEEVEEALTAIDAARSKEGG